MAGPEVSFIQRFNCKCSILEPSFCILIGNLLPFGDVFGDLSLTNTDDGSSSALVKTNLTCPFFGRNESILYVSLWSMGTEHNVWFVCFYCSG